MRKPYLMVTAVFCLFACNCGKDSHPTAAGLEEHNSAVIPSEPMSNPEAGDDVIAGPISKKLQVVVNCRTVQMAVEQFAAQNGGVYPSNVSADRTPAGNTLIDLLPDGILLENPFWKVRTEPVDGAAAQEGQTGYVPLWCDGVSKGYCITGCGKQAVWIVTIIKHCSGEAVERIGRQDP